MFKYRSGEPFYVVQDSEIPEPLPDREELLEDIDPEAWFLLLDDHRDLLDPDFNPDLPPDWVDLCSYYNKVNDTDHSDIGSLEETYLLLPSWAMDEWYSFLDRFRADLRKEDH